VARRAPALASLSWLLAHPRVASRVPERPPGTPATVLAIAIIGWVALFSRLVLWRHDRFATFDHDLAIWDQAVWLLAHGESFITVRGLDVFGFHASPVLYLFVPIYWLGGGADALNVTMTAVLGAGAVAVFRAARHHLGDDWHALVPAVAFLVNYAGQWMVWETFHPEVLAITPLLFAYLAALHGRWRAYGVWIVLAVACKEDVALAVASLGLVLAVRGPRSVGAWLAARSGQVPAPGPPGTRRAGVATVAFAVVWFVVATQVLIPAFSPGGNFTETLFGELGSSPTEITTTLASDPQVIAERLERADGFSYVSELTASFGHVPLIAPLALVMGGPQLLINLLASYDFFWTTRVHYAAMPLFATAVAAVEGLARLRARMPLRRALLGVMAIGAFYTAVSWGLSPVSPAFRQGHWPHGTSDARHARLTRTVALPRTDESVSSTYFLVPHLSHRRHIYTFPNPWVASNWGVRGERLPDPSTVDWLIVDPTAIAPAEQPLLRAVLADPDRSLVDEPPAGPDEPWDPGAVADGADGRRWEVVIDEADLLAARRRR
jgi:uncharacterized membrane protein